MRENCTYGLMRGRTCPATGRSALLHTLIAPTGDWKDDKAYPYLRLPLSFRSEQEWKLKKTTECDYNLYFNPTKDLKDVKWGTQNCSWDDWRGKYLQDAHSVWGDPLFVDAAHHDYRLKPDSPALKLGFRPIDLTTVGPRTQR